MPPQATLSGPPETRGRRRSTFETRIETFFIALVAILLAVSFAPTTLLLAFAMLPTAVTAVVDGDRRKNLTLAVGSLNLAGAIPALLELWARWNTIAGAAEMIGSVHPWQMPYLGAAIGLAMAFLIPPVTAMVMQKTVGGRMDLLQQRLDQLREVWGEDADPLWVAPVPDLPPSEMHAQAAAAEAVS